MQISRTVAVVALALSMGGTAQAAGDSAAVTDTYRALYVSGMKCFVANGHAAGLRRRAGDEAKATFYEAKGKEAFDVAVGAGKTLGYDSGKISSDFGLTQARELPAMVTDKPYFLKAVADCKALGLM